jgi:enoyl-CoA hydratase
MTNDILTRIDGHAGVISLNRPGAIHALTLDMVHAMTAALQAWKTDSAVQCVIIDHAEGRGFCAGGDIAFLRNSALNDNGVSGLRFFHDEYQLNHLLYTYPKPVVAFMDGITMGGGVGISQPAHFRVATSNTRFAMPETGIGLFPDVGGGWYLSRLEGRVGQFLALTGARIDGAECLALGLATHYLASEALAEAKARIATEDVERIDGILGTLAETAPDARILGNIFDINRHFASDRYEDILASLDGDDSAWAVKELATLRTKSPQTCKVALRQLHESAALSDFADNDNQPKWDPASAEGVSVALIDAIFAPLPTDEEWKPL